MKRSKIVRIVEKYAGKGKAIVVATHINIGFKRETTGKIAFINNEVIVKISKYR